MPEPAAPRAGSARPARPARRRSWSRAWRRVLYSARTSVIITVALVPPLIDQVLRLIGDVSPWKMIVAMLAMMLVVFWFFARQELKLQAVGEPDHGITKIKNTGWITSLVCPANLRVPLAGEGPVQSLLRNLTQVSAVRLILSEGADAEEAKEALREWALRETGREITVDTVSHRLNPFQLTESDVDQLSAELRHLDLPNLVVDITGGTKVMGIATYQAAVRANLPVTYIAQVREREYAGLSAINDPNQVFTSTGPATETVTHS